MMSHWVAGAALILLLLLCVSFCLTQLSEVDFYWHLLAGERILQEGRVPRVDSFTYTSSGRPWIDLHWLFQISVAAVYRTAGWPGIDALKIGCVCGALALVLVAAGRSGAPAAIILPLALVSVVAAQERFTLRPEVASFLFLGALLAILRERREQPRLLLGLPVLLAVWANCHALYVVGLAVIVLTFAGDFIDARRLPEGSPGRRLPAGPWLLAGVAVASIAATALTPYGRAGWALPYHLLFQRIAAENVYAHHIAEFQSPFGGYHPTASIGAFALLAVIVIGGAIFGTRAAGAGELLILGALLSVALLARRNIPLFALAAVPCAAPALEAALRRSMRRMAISGREGGCGPAWAAPAVCAAVGVAALVLLADVWSNRFFERDGTQRYFGRGPAPGFYPEGAADFIRRENPPGEVMNMMSVGGYLAWRWFPPRRVFIDGRLEVHDESLFKAYLRLQRDPVVFEQVARKYGVDTVVLSHRQNPESSALLNHLAESGDWRPVFLDLSACVFMRAPAAGVDAPRALDLRDPDLGVRILQQVRDAGDAAGALDPAPALLRRFLPRRAVPVAEVNAALFFGTVGGDQAAETLFRAALAQTPHNPIIHYDLGIVLDHSGQPAAARSEFDIALSEDASFGAAREALALRRLEDGDPEDALREWSIAERSWPLSSTSLQTRGRLLAGRGRFDEAIDDYRRAVDEMPWDSRLRADLALLYHRAGLPERAEAELSQALAIDPRACAPRVALGRMRAADGRTGEAERALHEAIDRAEGGCPEAEQALRDLQERKGVAR